MTRTAPLVPAPPEPAAPLPPWSDRLLARLSRKTTSGRFIPEIDGLRFVALAAVVLFHLGGFVFAKSANTAPLTGIDGAIHRLAGSLGASLLYLHNLIYGRGSTLNIVPCSRRPSPTSHSSSGRA